MNSGQRTYKRWTAEDDAILRAGLVAGESHRAIALRCGHTVKAVDRRAGRVAADLQQARVA